MLLQVMVRGRVYCEVLQSFIGCEYGWLICTNYGMCVVGKVSRMGPTFM